jgi:hypothetical protein
MNVPCPHCREDFAVPDQVLKRGVARVTCGRCSFTFVIRLGDPGASKPKPAPAPLLPIEGLKSSRGAPAAAGEIGVAQKKFIAADTRTTVLVDPALQEEVERAVDPVMIAAEKTAAREPTERDLTMGGAAAAPPALPATMPPPAAEPVAAPFRSRTDTLPLPGAPGAPIVPPADPARSDTLPLPIPQPADPALFDTLPLAGAPIARPIAPPSSVAQGDTARLFGVPAQSDTAPMSPLAMSPTAPDLELAEPAPAADAFESFRPVGAVTAPPPGAELPRPTAAASPPPLPVPPLPPEQAHAMAAAATAVYPPGYPPGYAPPGHAAATPPGYPPGYPRGPMLVPTGLQASGLDEFVLELPDYLRPQHSKGMKIFGVMMMLLFILALLSSVFILYQNDWRLDLTNFGAMIDRAFGRAPKQTGSDLQRGLELTTPIIEEAKLGSGERVVTAQGAIKNNDTRARKFIYVKAILKDHHDHTVVTDEAPAGNMFSKEELATLTKSQILSHLNPAGKDGRNARVQPGDSVAYMVVITDLPADYSRAKHHVTIEVSQAEVIGE